MRRLLVLLVATFAVASMGFAQVQTSTFVADLSPTSETPPVTETDASGTAIVTITQVWDNGVLISAIVDFRIMWAFGQPETLRAMHIHRGAAGVGGGVVIGSQFGPPIDAPAGSGTFLRTSADLTDATSLAVVAEILASPADFYVNLHSVSNPPGLIRGQLRWANHMMLSTLLDRQAATDAKVDGLVLTVEAIARRLGLI